MLMRPGGTFKRYSGAILAQTRDRFTAQIADIPPRARAFTLVKILFLYPFSAFVFNFSTAAPVYSWPPNSSKPLKNSKAR